jgi:RNA polymerase sigma-70 factor (ECF subfamily)
LLNGRPETEEPTTVNIYAISRFTADRTPAVRARAGVHRTNGTVKAPRRAPHPLPHRVVPPPSTAATASSTRPRPVFGEIFRDHYAFVCAVLASLGVRDADREDVAQDVFLTVHRRLDDFDVERPFRPWLLGISRRVALRYRMMARHRRELMHDEIIVVDVTPGAEEQLGDHQARALLDEALDSLDDRLRAVFELSVLGEAAMPEIADGLSIPLNTAYSRLRRARSVFSAAVKRLRARSRFIEQRAELAATRA